MKNQRFYTVLSILSLVFIAIGTPLIVAHAAPAAGAPIQETQPVDFGLLLDSLKNLLGVGAFIAALVNIGKESGVVKDGQAGTWAAGLNILALAGLLIAQATGQANLVPALDAQAGDLAHVINVVFAFAFQLFATRKAHDSILAGLPVIGVSHSGRMAGEQFSMLETSVE